MNVKLSPMQVFEAKKSLKTPLILLGVLVILATIFPSVLQDIIELPFVILPLIVPFLLYAWVYKSTVYSIRDSSILHYVSGPMKGEIEINRIKKIKQNVKYYVGKKPALASNGLLISYDRFSKIYMAPEDVESFIAAIKKINPDVEVE